MAMVHAIKYPPSAAGVHEPKQVIGTPNTLARTEKVARSVLSKTQIDALFSGIPKYVSRASKRIIPHLGGSNLQEYLYAHGDVNGVTRYTETLWTSVQSYREKRPNGFNLGPHAYATFGLTSISSLATGAVAGADGMQEIKKAVHIGDDVALTTGILRVFRGMLEVFSGAVVTTFRILSLIPSASAATVGALGKAGMIGYISMYVLMATTFGIAAHDIRKFRNVLEEKNKESPASAYDFLYKSVTLQKEELEEAFNLIELKPTKGVHYDDQQILVRAYKSMRMGRLDTSGLPKSVIEKFEMLQKVCPDDTWDTLDKLLRKKSFPYHRETNVAKVLDCLLKHMEKRHAKVGRSVGVMVLNRLLYNGSNPSETVKCAVVEQALKKATKHFRLYAFLSFTCVFSAAISILSLVFTAGLSHVVVSAGMLASGVLMTGIDGYFLVEALKDKRPKKWENIAMTAFTLFFLGAGIAATVMSGGLVPVLILSTVCFLWFALYIYTQSAWAKPHEEKHRYDETIRIGAPAPSGI